MAVGSELSRAGGIFSKAYTAFHTFFRAVRRFYTAVVVLVFVNLTMNLRANGGNPYIARLGGRFDFIVKAKSDGGFARSRIRSAGDGNPFLFGQLTLRFFQRVGGFVAFCFALARAGPGGGVSSVKRKRERVKGGEASLRSADGDEAMSDGSLSNLPLRLLG